MGSSTGIEWTDSTWNPVTGCTKVSAGCDNCYAATLAHRLLRLQYTARTPVLNSPETAKDPFAVRLWPERLADPLFEHRPRMIFVNSMSDLFHPHIPTAFIREIFHVMLEADWHVFQVLTKRPARALRFWKDNADLFGGDSLPEHIWLGASVENQEANYRVRHLRAVPARVRFLSCEPLIGPLELDLNRDALGDCRWREWSDSAADEPRLGTQHPRCMRAIECAILLQTSGWQDAKSSRPRAGWPHMG